MAELADEMLRAIIVETVDTLPASLLSSYRNPPGRKPHEHSLRIQAAIANLDDATAITLIRDAVDATIFQMLYLFSAGFKDARIETTISRGRSSEALTDLVLTEDYRMKVDPGGMHNPS